MGGGQASRASVRRPSPGPSAWPKYHGRFRARARARDQSTLRARVRVTRARDQSTLRVRVRVTRARDQSTLFRTRTLAHTDLAEVGDLLLRLGLGYLAEVGDLLSRGQAQRALLAHVEHVHRTWGSRVKGPGQGRLGVVSQPRLRNRCDGETGGWRTEQQSGRGTGPLCGAGPLWRQRAGANGSTANGLQRRTVARSNAHLRR